jgi:hypothetical protein
VIYWQAQAPDLPPAGWHDRWADATVAISSNESLRTLQRLGLARCGIGVAGGQALANSPHVENLAVLDLTDNPLSPTVRYQLLDQFGPRVIFSHRDHTGFRVRDLFW